MTGKEIVNYLRSKYQDGKDYADLRVIVRKRMIQVHSPSQAMQAELKEMGFEIDGWWATKSWPEAQQEQEKVNLGPKEELSISYSGMISMGLQVIGQGKWDEATKQYIIPADFQIPEWVK